MYSIDDNVSYNEKGQMYINIGPYKVIQIKEGLVYVCDNKNRLITHCDKWKRATKTAKLLLNAYTAGYNKAIHDYVY